MKIRTQLVALVSGVMLPLVVLAALITYSLWDQQRQAYQQQFLERASALRLALDTEFEVTLRALKATGESVDLSAPDPGPRLQRRFDGFLANNPDWMAVAAVDSEGRLLVSSDRAGALAMPPAITEGIRTAIHSRNSFVSNLVAAPDGRHIVFVATTFGRDGHAQGAVYAVVDHRHWLEFLRAYPVSERAVLTLNDTSSTLVTRTLDDERWVGKKSSAAFWSKAAGQPSGSFQTTSLEGIPFYSAFSRSKVSGWVLSTGVPRDEVEAALRGQTMMVAIVILLAVLGALLAAWFLGRRVNTSMTALEKSARSLSDAKDMSVVALPIQEAETVRQAMVEAHGRLLARETSLNAALLREEAAREHAESGSRAKDRFLAMMGHELRNPMSAIASAVEVLGKDGVPPTAVARTRDIIRRQAGHMGGMINDLMDVAQLGAGAITLHRARLDLARLTIGVVDRFTDSGRCSHLQLKLEHVPAWIDADESRVAQIITNVLDNACKYTMAGGTVTVTVRGEEQSSVLSVRDSGVGIAAQLAANMFEAFTQGDRSIDRSQGGLGLGLTLARWLVELHGGSIAAASDGPGTGATFTVRLPSAEPPTQEATPPAKASSDLLVTVVEDIADTREMMQILLSEDGRRVNVAADGPGGVEAILAGPSDVAVIDIGLPGFDGFEVARRVRQAPGGDQVVLIALTGYGSHADRDKAKNAGFDQFLIKPFDLERFETALDAEMSKISGRTSLKTV